MRRRIRVLHTIQNLNYGGMERVLANIVERIDPERFESHVLVFQYLGRFSEGLDAFAGLHAMDRVSRLSMLWPRSIARMIRSIAPDVVHSHSGVWYKSSLAARMAGVARVIHTDHGRQQPDPWQARLLDGLASRRTDVAVAVSDMVAAQLRDGIVRGRCRIEVVVNGVDTDSVVRTHDVDRMRTELSIEPDAPVIGSIGRLEPIKDYATMIDAFARLLGRWEQTPCPVLVIAGNGSERERLESAAAAARIDDRVRLLGWHDDIPRLLGAFTLFTMSSLSEGTSISLLEAMSARLCPVVTDVGGNSAVLGPALRHRLVPAADPEALAAAWLDALSNPQRRIEDGETARARVVAEYSLDRMVDRYQEIYEDHLPLGR